MKTFGGMIALLLVMTACTGGDGESEPPKKTTSTSQASEKPAGLQRDTTPAEAAWTADLDAIGQPVVVGTTAVVIQRAAGKRLEIVGVDTATGKQVWAHPFSPNYAVPGISLVPNVSRTKGGAERVIFYLAPDKPSANEDDLLTAIVSVDPATGEIDQESAKVHATEPVSACDDGTDVCVKGVVGPTGTYSNLRFDLETGKFSESSDGAPKDARLIGSAGLFSTGDRPGEKLGVRRAGKTLWSTSLDTLFGKGYTSDNGWVFAHETGPDRYTGLVGAPNDTVTTADSEKAEFVYELAKQKVISFNGKDGTVLWSREGADPCFRATDFDDEQAVVSIDHPIRCLVTGKYTRVGDVTTPEGITMTMEGYDPVSGETTWSQHITDAAAAAYWQDAPRVLIRGGTTVVATLDAGPSLIDTATGKTAPVGDETFVCQTGTVDFDYVTPFEYDDRKVFGRHGTGLLSSCDVNGGPVPGAPTAAAVREGGIKVGESTYVMATADGLVGYQLGEG